MKMRDSEHSEVARPTVLVVDDEPLTRKALHRLLRKADYALHFAETPAQALDFVQSQPVDLVITDQRMPDMSGVELLRAVHRAAPDTSGLILTAYPESVFVDDPPESPRPPLFSKPWDDDTLLASIEAILGKREASKETAARPAERRILVPVDGSIEAELSLGSALPLFEGDPLKILLLRVVPELGLHRDVYTYLEKTRDRLASQGIDATADVRWGDPVEQILLHARHARADLIVLPRHRERSLARRIRRSVAERILQRSELPLLVSRPDLALRPFRSILVLLDGTREAEVVLAEAVRVARKTGATIDIVGVESAAALGYGAAPRNPVPYLTEVAGLLDLEDVTAEPFALVGDVAREVLIHAQERGSDLLCMSDRAGAGWLRRLRGSPAAQVLRRAPCPVYVRRIRPA
jgi:nucleotide-binding universal stress UspA family protein/CheY-like chemotaxis protein